MKGVLVSAHNPMTGPRHLGHLASTMIEWKALQDEYECYFVVDDLIADFIYPIERRKLQNRTFFTIRDFLAAGVNPHKCHIAVSSLVPEFLELMTILGSLVDLEYCLRLHARSFAGLLAPYHRAQLGLSNYESVTEVVYPQLGLPCLTLGLQADVFQGGEEVLGYGYIMEDLVKVARHLIGHSIRAPKFLAPKAPYVRGPDGEHMVAGNAIVLASDPAEVRSAVERVQDTRVLAEWYRAVGRPELARRLPASRECTPELTSEMADFMVKFLEPFRTFKIDNETIAGIVQEGSWAARSRIRKTCDLVRTAVGLPTLGE